MKYQLKSLFWLTFAVCVSLGSARLLGMDLGQALVAAYTFAFLAAPTVAHMVAARMPQNRRPTATRMMMMLLTGPPLAITAISGGVEQLVIVCFLCGTMWGFQYLVIALMMRFQGRPADDRQ